MGRVKAAPIAAVVSRLETIRSPPRPRPSILRRQCVKRDCDNPAILASVGNETSPKPSVCARRWRNTLFTPGCIRTDASPFSSDFAQPGLNPQVGNCSSVAYGAAPSRHLALGHQRNVVLDTWRQRCTSWLSGSTKTMRAIACRAPTAWTASARTNAATHRFHVFSNPPLDPPLTPSVPSIAMTSCTQWCLCVC